MELILTENCKALSGSLGHGFGYFIVERRGRYYSVRSKHPNVPPDGHLRFIFACAEMVYIHLYLAEIVVPPSEIEQAFAEAGFPILASVYGQGEHAYNADSILAIRKNHFNL